MAQTKRKRRSKHRGNAAGSIEARGRTGRRPSGEELKKASRAEARARRMSKPPTWQSAFLKSGLMAALLFVMLRVGLLGSEASTAQSLLVAAMALLMYTPLAYLTDRWVYQRNQRRQAQKR